MTGPTFDIVIPTIGRPSLQRLIASLARSAGPAPERLIVVDDRREPDAPLSLGSGLVWPAQVLKGPGRGPAAARNAGWRAATADWVEFLDDDVEVGPDWLERLAADLVSAPAKVAGVQGNIVVPLPDRRKPTDWERNVAGLQAAVWATADLAYRREVLARIGGFDTRFRRAYREDADLGLRVVRAGYRIVRGSRTVLHPPGPDRFWTSVKLQAGNADNILMRRIHGPGWRQAASAPAGRFRRHLAVTAAGAAGVAGLIAGKPALARLGGAAWLAGTTEFALARILPGPRTPAEVWKMSLTSAVLPAAATLHAGLGLVRHGMRRDRLPAAVLLDRDGTLVEDVPYNGDPERVLPKPGAREALDRLRRAGVPLAVVSNQSGIARGTLTLGQVERVNRRIEKELGPLGLWVICPHGPADACDCRKPAPGMIRQAARLLDVPADRCVVIGDIGADVQAALGAGATAILVPTGVTRPEEIRSAPRVAPDLGTAVDMLLRGEGR